MTNFEASEPAFDAACAELRAARSNLRYSKSARRIAAFVVANAKFDTALAACHAAREADEGNEVAKHAIAVAAEDAARRAAEPQLF